MPHLTPSDRIGTTVGGRYEIRRLLGEGGFSAVFEAVHNITGRSVALKLLHPHLVTTEQITERFLLEARAMARIRHDGIVQVLDAGKDPDGTVYIALELLEGEALENTLQRTNSITWNEAVSIGIDVLGALAEAHRNKIIHRDIKPGNIFITRKSNGGSQAKLLDFGIAHVAQAKGRFTQQGVILGTPEYMSPEQARAGIVGPEADLWSVGIVLFECITGATPFLSENTTEILLKVQTDRAPELHSILPAVPKAVSDVVRCALEREVSARYRSADEMREALERAAASSEAARTPSRSVLRAPSLRKVPAVTVEDVTASSPEANIVPRVEVTRSPQGARTETLVAAPPTKPAAGGARLGDPPKPVEAPKPPEPVGAKTPEPPRGREEGVQVIRPGRLVVEEVVSSRRYGEDEPRSARRVSHPGAEPDETPRGGVKLAPAKAGDTGDRPRFSLDDVIEGNAASAVSAAAAVAAARKVEPQPLPAAEVVPRTPRESGPELKRDALPRSSSPDTPSTFTSPSRGGDYRGTPAKFSPPPASPKSGAMLYVGVGVAVVGGIVASAMLRPSPGPSRPVSARDASTAAMVQDAALPTSPPRPGYRLQSLHDVAVPPGAEASEFARHAAVSRGENVTTQRVIAACSPASDGAPTIYLHPLLRGDALGSMRAPVACAGFDLGVVSDVTGDGTDDVIAVSAEHNAVILFNSASRQVARSFRLDGARGIAVGAGFSAPDDTYAVVYTEPGGDEQPGTVIALGLRTGRVRWRASGRGGLGRFGQPVELGLAVGSDVNRDGIADIVVGLGSIIGQGGGPPQRCVQVLSGATGEPLWNPQCRGRGRGSQSVALGPDTNGDGVPDVIVGAERPDRDEPAVEIRSGTDGGELLALRPPPQVNPAGFGWPVAALSMGGGAPPLVVVGSVAGASSMVLVFNARSGALEARGEHQGVGAATMRLFSVQGNTPTAPWSLVVATPRSGISSFGLVPIADDDT